jgi:hypothetical protein
LFTLSQRTPKALTAYPMLRTTVLDNRLTDGGEVISLTRWPPFAPRKIPGTHFCQRLSRPQGHSATGRIRSIEKSSDLTGIRTHDHSACSIVPQPTMLPRAPQNLGKQLYTIRSYKYLNLIHDGSLSFHFGLLLTLSMSLFYEHSRC